MVTLKDVANLAEVSTWTASKVLSGGAHSEKISERSTNRVLEAAKKLNYSPNRQAKMLRQGKSMVIGILMTHSDQLHEYWNSFSGIMLSGMDFGIRAQGYDTLIIGAHRGGDPFEMAARYFSEKRIDGLLIPGPSCPRIMPVSLENTAGPVVLAGSDTQISFNRVCLDDAVGIRAAVRHLAELGHRRILWLSFDGINSSHPSVEQRREAFWSEVRAVNIEGDELLFTQPVHSCSVSTDAIRQARQVCLAQWEKIRSTTAVICYNERIALGLYAAANEFGVKIPEELSVIGFDDLVSAVAWPAMTTVSHQLVEIGQQSAALVCELSAKSDQWSEVPISCVKVDSTLVVRDSTAAPKL